MGWFTKDEREEDLVKIKAKETTEDEEETEEEDESEEDEYEVSLDCDNCGSEDSFWIPCGTTIDEFCKDKKCENCKCSLVQK